MKILKQAFSDIMRHENNYLNVEMGNIFVDVSHKKINIEIHHLNLNHKCRRWEIINGTKRYQDNHSHSW